MREKRFKQFGLWVIDDPNSNVNSVADLIDTKLMSTNEVVDLLNEQQATIDILLEELVNAQQQGYVVNFLHKNEHCSLIPKELEDE